MRNLSAALLFEANRLDSGNPWLLLYDIILPSNRGTIYLVRNNENVIFNGNEYIAFPLELDMVNETNKGDIQSLVLKVSNVTRIVQSYLEELEGLIGGQVIVRIVNYANLSEDYSELERTYDVTNSSADSQYVTLTLGAPNPLGKRFPLHKYLSDHCNWEFTDVECAYEGTDLTCRRVLEDCKNKNNSSRFGGHIGMGGGGIKVV